MMAKKKAIQETSGYDRIDAILNDGQVRFEYRVSGAARDGRIDGDEEVHGWTDVEIQELGCSLLGIDKKFASEINVELD